MFTGIIQAVGTVRQLQPRGTGMRVDLDAGALDLSGSQIGDSIAVSGVCITVVEFDQSGFAADLSRETLACTILGELEPGARVNLEPALRLSDRLGGHLVSGHVDGIGTMVECAADGACLRAVIDAPQDLYRYIAPKGSITVDGISLTVNRLQANGFEIMLIPQTMQHTTLGDARVGRRVNLEVDIVARYLDRLIGGRHPDSGASGGPIQV